MSFNTTAAAWSFGRPATSLPFAPIYGDYDMEIDSPIDFPHPSNHFCPPSATKPSYEELEHMVTNLRGQCQTLWAEKNNLRLQATKEVSSLQEANKAQRLALDRDKKVIKALNHDRGRARIEKGRIQLKINKLEKCCDMMVIDTDVAECERLQAQNKALEEELKTLQREYMELVEKSENEQKSASAQMSAIQSQMAQEAANQVAAVKQQMADKLAAAKKMVSERVDTMKQNMVSRVASMKEKAEGQVANMKEKMDARVAAMNEEMAAMSQELAALKGDDKEVKFLKHDLRVKYKKHCERSDKRERQKYNKKLAILEHGLSTRYSQFLNGSTYSSPSEQSTLGTTPSTAPPASPYTPATPCSTPPTTKFPEAHQSPETPQTPSPLFGFYTGPPKESNSVTEAPTPAKQEDSVVGENAKSGLQKYKLPRGCVRVGNDAESMKAALDASQRAHDRLRDSAIRTLHEYEAVEEQLKDVMVHRRLQERLASKKEEARKSRKPKRLSRQ
ncbi:hypothetical protein F4805DRAFT_181938 [Annulohypoxylon moriforme]|nr:hypothetical protein F4805DRAFT_181938 [Annulohypoxylon moriforme]